ncbi:hypothetical protein B5X24_HaOG215227 [Helicoverpa armigera]|nr:hypothetical protein B5X24_HaOG215227 [Helicoverpa armigera]
MLNRHNILETDFLNIANLSTRNFDTTRHKPFTTLSFIPYPYSFPHKTFSSSEMSEESTPPASLTLLKSTSLKRLARRFRSSSPGTSSIKAERSSDHRKSSLLAKGAGFLHRSRQRLQDSRPSRTHSLKRRHSSEAKLDQGLSGLPVDEVTSDSDLVRLQPCTCENSSLAQVFTRWDNLLVVLVCATVIMLILSTPISVFLGRRERRL